MQGSATLWFCLPYHLICLTSDREYLLQFSFIKDQTELVGFEESQDDRFGVLVHT